MPGASVSGHTYRNMSTGTALFQLTLIYGIEKTGMVKWIKTRYTDKSRLRVWWAQIPESIPWGFDGGCVGYEKMVRDVSLDDTERDFIMENTNVKTTEAQSTSSIQFLTVTAIFVALTYVFTAFVNIRLPIAANGGLVHLGNVPLFIGAIIFGKKYCFWRTM